MRESIGRGGGVMSVPGARLLWLWFAVALLLLGAPFSSALRLLAQLALAALVLVAAGDWLHSRGWLDELVVVPVAGRERAVQGREWSLVFEIRQQRVRARRLLLAVRAAGEEGAAALGFSAEPALLAVPAQPATKWTCSVVARRRGVYYGLLLGLACDSRLGFWQWRARRFAPIEIRVHPDWRVGRKVMLSSPLYQLVSGTQRRPMMGPGCEFERLREYLPGDSYSDLSWKATARRGFPVSRVYQWEQRQDVYLCLDHARLSALGPGLAAAGAGDSATVLDLFVATALAAALACHELGDRLGLVAFAAGVSRAVPSGHGNAHLARCREALAEMRPSAVTADYAALAAYLKAGLRRRSWLLILTALGEPGQDEELLRVLQSVRAAHAVTVLGLLPPETEPLPFAVRRPGAGTAAAGGGPPAASLDDIYRRLAGHREYRRLRELRRQFAVRGLDLQLEPAARYARTGVEAYLDRKRRQAL